MGRSKRHRNRPAATSASAAEAHSARTDGSSSGAAAFVRVQSGKTKVSTTDKSDARSKNRPLASKGSEKRSGRGSPAAAGAGGGGGGRAGAAAANSPVSPAGAGANAVHLLSGEALYRFPNPTLLTDQQIRQRLEFFLYGFKTRLCPSNSKHTKAKLGNVKSSCLFYHEPAKGWDFARRRNPAEYVYEPTPCPNVNSSGQLATQSWRHPNRCPKGNSCPMAHTTFEIMCHPEKYKMLFCSRWDHVRQECPNGIACAYAHDRREMRPVRVARQALEEMRKRVGTTNKSLSAPRIKPEPATVAELATPCPGTAATAARGDRAAAGASGKPSTAAVVAPAEPVGSKRTGRSRGGAPVPVAASVRAPAAAGGGARALSAWGPRSPAPGATRTPVGSAKPTRSQSEVEWPTLGSSVGVVASSPQPQPQPRQVAEQQVDGGVSAAAAPSAGVDGPSVDLATPTAFPESSESIRPWWSRQPGPTGVLSPLASPQSLSGKSGLVLTRTASESSSVGSSASGSPPPWELPGGFLLGGLGDSLFSDAMQSPGHYPAAEAPGAPDTVVRSHQHHVQHSRAFGTPNRAPGPPMSSAWSESGSLAESPRPSPTHASGTRARVPFSFSQVPGLQPVAFDVAELVLRCDSPSLPVRRPVLNIPETSSLSTIGGGEPRCDISGDLTGTAQDSEMLPHLELSALRSQLLLVRHATQQAEARLLCYACQRSEASVLLQPCGHRVCSSCSLSAVCPCNVAVAGRVSFRL